MIECKRKEERFVYLCYITKLLAVHFLNLLMYALVSFEDLHQCLYDAGKYKIVKTIVSDLV